MKPSSLDMAEYLEQNRVGKMGQTIFIGKTPDSPKTCITLFDVSPYGSGHSLAGAVNYDYTSIQVRIRAVKYLEGWNLAQQVNDVLHGLHGYCTDTIQYMSVQNIRGPRLFDWDENNNVRITIQYDIQRRNL